MTRVLVTGASGFVGLPLACALARSGSVVWAAARDLRTIPEQTNVNPIVLPDLSSPITWNSLVAGMETVIHLAGVAHVSSDIPEATYDQVNRAATQSLAQSAAENGTKHFIFVSSIRAQSGPTADKPLTESNSPQPTDAYGRSKLAAEEAIRKSGVPFTILRPVTIYGHGAKRNVASMIKLADSRFPLPFGRFRNLRSLLAMENLISAIRFLLEQGPRNETYVVADPAPVTFGEIFLGLREALGRPPRMINVPPSLLTGMLYAVGKRTLAEQIGGTLVADAHKLRMAGWRPSVSTQQAIAALFRPK